MGRSTLLDSTKRWYSFPLSAQEIALAVRSGFVMVEVEASADSISYPVIDAVEVYASERRDIENLLPWTLQSLVPSSNSMPDEAAFVRKSSQESFRLCLLALSTLKNMLAGVKHNRTERAFIKQLIQDTFTSAETEIQVAVEKIVSSVEHDADARQAFHDKAVLSGCAVFLKECQTRFEAIRNGTQSYKFHKLWHFCTPHLRACILTASKIARMRPFNYLKAADESSNVLGSIAADAGILIAEALATCISSSGLIADYVELALLETKVVNGKA
jgi:hypothetical protein